MKIARLVNRDVVTVRPEQAMDAAIALMEENAIHHLPVVTDGRVIGMVSDRDVLLAVGWRLSSERRAAGVPGGIAGPTRIEQVMSHPVVTLTPEDTLSRAASIMTGRKIGALPIVSGHMLVGIVTEMDLLLALRQGLLNGTPAGGLLTQPVSSHMHADVLTVRPRDSIVEIIRLMRDKNIRHAPVTVDDWLGRRLIGMVSDRDVRRALGAAAVSDAQAQSDGALYLGPTQVLEIMSRGVRTIEPHASIGELIDELSIHRIHAMPVASDAKLLGIITQTDVVRAMGAADAD